MINKFQILNIIRKNELILICLIILAGLAFSTNLFLIPNINRVQQIYSQKNLLQKQLNKLKQKENALLDIDDKYYQNVLTKLFVIIPDSKDYINLFETLDELEKRTSVKVLRTDFQLGPLAGGGDQTKKSSIPGVSFLPIAIDIQGDYLSVQNFLNALSDFKGRIIIIDKVFVNTEKDNNYKLSMSGNTFIVSAPTAIGSLDSPLPKINNTQQEIIDRIAALKSEIGTFKDQEKVTVGKKNLFD